MPVISLLSCTKSKLKHAAPARNLYSPSALFRASWNYAEKVSDRAYILSAKHGLLHPDETVEPYDETLVGQSTARRRQWAETVVRQLREVADLQHDRFIMLAGMNYIEFLLPHLHRVEQPLEGLTLGQRISALQSMVQHGNRVLTAEEVHHFFAELPRYSADSLGKIPFVDGIYVFFEKDERYLGMDRIVRVGTHRADGRLVDRLRYHYELGNVNSSIFRRNIARVMLGDVNVASTTDLERKISKHMRESFSVACVPVTDRNDRLSFEAGLIATLSSDNSYQPGESWYGLKSPIEKIRRIGLWNVQGLGGRPLSCDEFERLRGVAPVRTVVSEERQTQDVGNGTVSALEIHKLVVDLPRYNAQTIGSIPFANGIEVFFERGESFHGMDRIVRVGTHRTEGRLKRRIADHLRRPNLDGSIFRKHIGCALTGTLNPAQVNGIEDMITNHLTENMTFTCLPVDDADDRERFKEGLIATLHSDADFGPGGAWLGNRSLSAGVRKSGLWNVQELDGTPLTRDEYSRLAEVVDRHIRTHIG